MPRPSRNTDLLLIAAGKKLLPATGVSGLSLRKVAAAAKVNLGMFSYHFGSKREFTRRVLQDIYEEFFKDFTLESSRGADPEARLEAALCRLGRFAAENRGLLVALLRDAIDGDPEVLRFAKENLPRHLGIITGLVRECRRKGLLGDAPLPQLIPFLIVSVVAPNAVAGLLERTLPKLPFGLPLALFKPMLLSEEANRFRAKAAIKGLGRVV
ncbi:MAG: hypothetical protein A2X36_11010 [Elusimicrobia bacterium GWA2_69_24]|nr:MAG: hypothetical protein A2X36_11010 [Elusimicrobia bacterium GWA2_69_24]HBL17371.1 TetR family transcriptional regulator [Elusimicrobiota bacterium]